MNAVAQTAGGELVHLVAARLREWERVRVAGARASRYPLPDPVRRELLAAAGVTIRRCRPHGAWITRRSSSGA